jgi:hypothetical protein
MAAAASSGQPAAASATQTALAAILETKDARINILERELALHERELQRIREIPEQLLIPPSTAIHLMDQRPMMEPFAHFTSSLGLNDPTHVDPRVKRHVSPSEMTRQHTTVNCPETDSIFLNMISLSQHTYTPATSLLL